MTIAAHSVSPLTGIGQVPDLQANGTAEYSLVPTNCVLCRHDDAEPVAVGQDFADPASSETFLAVCCRTCGLVYLNPTPALKSAAVRESQPEGQVRRANDEWKISPTVTREITRFAKRLPHQGRLLQLVRGQGERLDTARHCLGDTWRVDTASVGSDGLIEESNLSEGTYDAVILSGVAELTSDPLSTLKAVKRLLCPDGLVLVVTPNTGSAAGRLFRGRHWSAYRFPQHLNLFDGKSLGRAAGLAGLELVSIHTAPAATVWVESIRNLLADWGAPTWAVGKLSHKSFLANAVSGAIEWSQQILSKGGLLVATLRRSR